MTEQELREEIDNIVASFGSEISVQPSSNYPSLREGATSELMSLIKTACYLIAKRELPECTLGTKKFVMPNSGYKEGQQDMQLDMLQEVDGVSFKAVKEFKK